MWKLGESFIVLPMDWRIFVWINLRIHLWVIGAVDVDATGILAPRYPPANILDIGYARAGQVSQRLIKQLQRSR